MEQKVEDFIPFNNIIRKHLLQIRKWGVTLSVIGFVLSVIGLLAALIVLQIGPAGRLPALGLVPRIPLKVISAVFYCHLAALFFFPSLFLHKFCAKLKVAFNLHDEIIMGDAFLQLSTMIKIVVVMIIISFVLYASLVALITSSILRLNPY